MGGEGEGRLKKGGESGVNQRHMRQSARIINSGSAPRGVAVVRVGTGVGRPRQTNKYHFFDCRRLAGTDLRINTSLLTLSQSRRLIGRVARSCEDPRDFWTGGMN